MAGLTAPKLLWLARHEPEVLARARHMLLPKDIIRLHLTGARVTDVSDAAGTWLLDEESRSWSEQAIAAVGIDPALLPASGGEPDTHRNPAAGDRLALRLAAGRRGGWGRG